MTYEILSPEYLTKSCNQFLSERIVQLETNMVNNLQYYHKSLEKNLAPISISNRILESNI